MPPRKYVMNQVGYKERHSWEVMDTDLETSVGCPEDQGGDAILEHC